jgi:hypothetical protein
MAHQLVHPAPLRFGDYSERAQRLAPGCLPVVSSDGLALYYYALTAHFGAWVQTLGERRRVWMVAARLLAKRAHVIKRDTCPPQVRVAAAAWPQSGTTSLSAHRMRIGRPDAPWVSRVAFRYILSEAEGQRSSSGSAFGVTIHRSIAGLARRSWTLRAARSLGELALPFEGWRGYYHSARPHASLRPVIGGSNSQPGRPRYRQRTPAQAAGLTDRRWTVRMLIAYPAPPLKVG